MIASLIYALLATIAGQERDPLGPAAQGMRQCYKPDVASKTCQSLASYTADGTGGFLNGAEVLVAQGVTFETTTHVRVQAGAVCGSIQRADTEAGILRIDRRVIEGEQRAKIVDAVVKAYTPFFGREICTTYVNSGSTLRAIATLDGAPDKLPELNVVWVSPDDGYRVGTP